MTIWTKSKEIEKQLHETPERSVVHTGRSHIDVVFILKQLYEKAVSRRMVLYLTFIHFHIANDAFYYQSSDNHAAVSAA